MFDELQYQNPPPVLPQVKIPRIQSKTTDLFLSRQTKEETDHDQQQPHNIRQLKKYSLYHRNDSLNYIFSIGPTSSNDAKDIQYFLSKQQPSFMQYLVESKKNKFSMVKCGIGKYYVGEMFNGKCHGFGIFLFEDGRIYEGTLENNHRQGEGLAVNVDKSWYFGEFLNDKKDGQGLEVSRLYTYQGGYVNGLKHGNGTLVGSNLIYTGQWRLGIIHGFGTLETDESRYQGYFLNFLKHGSGKQAFTNGDIYIGNYFNGRPEGEGEYHWSKDGCVFKGVFKNGHRDGKGVWSNSEGDKFVGYYKDDVKAGYGEFYWRSGNFYKGNFAEDLRDGYGQMFWAEGSVYKGQWRKGVQHGKGELYLVGQDTLTGIFQNNILVSLLSSPSQQVMKNSNFSLSEFNLGATEPLVSPPTRKRFSLAEMQRTSYKKTPVNPININSKSKSKSRSRPHAGSQEYRSPKGAVVHQMSPGGSHHRFCKACSAKSQMKESNSFRIGKAKGMSKTYNLKDSKKKEVLNQYMRNHAQNYLKFKF